MLPTGIELIGYILAGSQGPSQAPLLPVIGDPRVSEQEVKLESFSPPPARFVPTVTLCGDGGDSSDLIDQVNQEPLRRVETGVVLLPENGYVPVSWEEVDLTHLGQNQVCMTIIPLGTRAWTACIGEFVEVFQVGQVNFLPRGRHRSQEA